MTLSLQHWHTIVEKIGGRRVAHFRIGDRGRGSSLSLARAQSQAREGEGEAHEGEGEETHGTEVVPRAARRCSGRVIPFVNTNSTKDRVIYSQWDPIMII